MNNKDRKSFNLSLQKKRNSVILSPIIKQCEDDGSGVSEKVIDYVEKGLIFERSIGLNKVLSTFTLISNTLSSHHYSSRDEHTRRVEDVLKSVVQIDGARLAEFLSDPISFSNELSGEINDSNENSGQTDSQNASAIESFISNTNPQDEFTEPDIHQEEQLESEPVTEDVENPVYEAEPSQPTPVEEPVQEDEEVKDQVKEKPKSTTTRKNNSTRKSTSKRKQSEEKTKKEESTENDSSDDLELNEDALFNM